MSLRVGENWKSVPRLPKTMMLARESQARIVFTKSLTACAWAIRWDSEASTALGVKERGVAPWRQSGCQ